CHDQGRRHGVRRSGIVVPALKIRSYMMSHPSGVRTGRPPTYAPHGGVPPPHYLASAAGLNALQSGGSAVDAAIAANAVLCVVYPHMAGLGGDGFWLIAEPGTGAVHGLNASGPAAPAATLDGY